MPGAISYTPYDTTLSLHIYCAKHLLTDLSSKQLLLNTQVNTLCWA